MRFLAAALSVGPLRLVVLATEQLAPESVRPGTAKCLPAPKRLLLAGGVR